MHVSQLFDAPTVSVMSEYLENRLALGENKNPDDTTKIAYYADPLAEVFLRRATSFISEEVGEELIPTYSYARVYQPGEKLYKHVDRESCEISATVNIAFKGKPNKIYMQKEGNGESSFSLNPGDAVIYKGCEIVHWREPLENDQLVVQIMLHYVRKNGPYSNLIFDSRPRLGAKSCR